MNLTTLPLTITGTHASNYSITTQPTSPIIASDFKDFVIQFTPSAAGTRTASISIANNDSNENPCSISLTGVGTLANDECSGAIALTTYSTESCGGSTSGTTSGATSSGVGVITCDGSTSTTSNDVWYSFVASSTSHIITVVGVLDAVVDLRSGSCPGTTIACADAFGSNSTEIINATGLTTGESYLVRIYGYNTSSGTFTVCVTTPPPPYYYRTKANGAWELASTWQISTDNTSWIDALDAPSLSDLEITINHSVTISSSAGTVTIDELIITSGATIDITGGTLSISDGTGDDLQVYGILRSAGTISGSGTKTVKSGGIYQHNPSSGAGSIPALTWETGSTCEILKATATPGGLNQAYYNFIWNSSTHGGATINLTGDLQNIDGNFTISNTGTGKLRLTSSTVTVSVGGDVTVSSGTQLQLGNGTGSPVLSISGDLNISGGTLDLMGANGGTGKVLLQGDFTCSGTIAATGTGTRSIEFGGGGQTMSITGSILNSPIFNINNSGIVSLTSNITLPTTASISLTSGKIDLSGYNLEVSIITGTPATWGNSTSNYILAESGKLLRPISALTLFPVGTSSEYLPCRLTGGGTFGVNISSTSSGLANPSLALPTQWNITDGSGTLNMDFQWNSSAIGTTAYLFKYNGTSWATVGGPIAASGSGPQTASFMNISCCSGFTISGSSSAVLPIELAFFQADLFNSSTKLTWQTASELNNSHFSIEKSQDGFNFREVGIVNGNGTTNETHDYEFVDKTPFSGTNYYRLKQFDFDGRFEYSKVVSVDFGREGGVRLYPTIASTELYLQLDKKAANESGIIHVFNQNGMLVKSQNFEAESLNLTIPVYGLPNGHYFIRLETADFASILRFIKQ